MTENKLYELINPSDPITFYAASDPVATAVALLVGRGQYGAERIEYDEYDNEEPADVGGTTLFLSEEEAEAQFIEWFGPGSLSEFLKSHEEEIIAALDSVATFSAKERVVYDDALAAITEPEKREEFILTTNDRARTSLNQIADYAHDWARKLRGEECEDVSAPRSVYGGLGV